MGAGGEGGSEEDGNAEMGMMWEGVREEKDSWHSADEGESQETLGENAEETVTNVEDGYAGGGAGAGAGAGDGVEAGMGRSEPLVGVERGGGGVSIPQGAAVVVTGGGVLPLKMSPLPVAFKCLSCRRGQVDSPYLVSVLEIQLNDEWWASPCMIDDEW